MTGPRVRRCFAPRPDFAANGSFPPSLLGGEGRRLLKKAGEKDALVPTLCVGTHVWTLCVPSTGNKGIATCKATSGTQSVQTSVPTQSVGTSASLSPMLFQQSPLRGRGVGVRGFALFPLTPDRGMTANRFAAPYFLVYGCSWRLHHDRTNTNATDEPAPLAGGSEGQKDHQGDHVQGAPRPGSERGPVHPRPFRDRCSPAGEGTAGQRAGSPNPAGERESPPGDSRSLARWSGPCRPRTATIASAWNSGHRFPTAILPSSSFRNHGLAGWASLRPPARQHIPNAY